MDIPPTAAAAAAAAAAGRARGQPNFKVSEDVMLAEAYVVVTTNAAIATDQNGSTFWAKVRLGFIQRGGSARRTSGSLQNRYNKTIQLEVNKFIGMLANTLREYHSGWALEDYTHDAKRRFLAKFQKTFKHEMCYGILKRSLTKFAIDMDAVHPRVRRAIFFCDNDNAPAPDANANGGDDDCDDVGGVADDAGGVRPCPFRAVGVGEPCGVVSPGIGMYTPRPTVGKKKAKKLLLSSSNASNKNKKPKNEVMCWANEKVIAQRSNSLAVLIEETKKKNVLAEQQFAYQFFREQPDTAEAKDFFKAMAKKYSRFIVEQEVPVVSASLESTPEESTPEDADVDNVLIVETEEDDIYEDDDDDDDVGEHFDSRGLFVPGGFTRDEALDNATAACARPVIDWSKLTGSDFSQDSECIGLNDTLPSLPCTQKLVAALQSNDNIERVVDSQMTTLG